MRSNIILKNIFPPLIRPSQAVPSPLQWHRETGNGDFGQFATGRFSCCSERGVLTLLQCGVPLTGDSSPQISSQIAAIWITLPWGAVLQDHRFYQQTCSSLGFSLRGSADPCHEPVPPLASHWFTTSFQASTCSSMGSCTGCKWISGSLVGLHVLQAQSCFTVVCKGNCRSGASLVPKSSHTNPIQQPICYLLAYLGLRSFWGGFAFFFFGVQCCFLFLAEVD